MTHLTPPLRKIPLYSIRKNLLFFLPFSYLPVRRVSVRAPAATELAAMAMDPDAAEWPCIIQALPALPPSPSSTGVPRLPTMVQALPAATDPPPAAARLRRGAEPPSPRRTRSGGAPEWTPAETLALVAEVAAVDDGWSRSVSAFQKWAIVAENLAASRGRAARGRGRGRAASECRRRWEALAAEYGVVRRWEVRGAGGYWRMSAAARRKAGLPADFDAEVYGAMEALTLVEEALLADATAGAGGAEIGEKSAAAAEVGEGDEVEAGEEDGNGDRGEVGEEDEGEIGEDGEEDGNEMVEVEDDGNADDEDTQPDGGNAAASDDLGMFLVSFSFSCSSAWTFRYASHVRRIG